MIGYDRARKKFVLRQFHIEVFVNTYVQQTGDSKKLAFVSESIESIAPGWRARETYLILNENEFIERFELAEPGKDFALYSEHLKRATQPSVNNPKSHQRPTNQLVTSRKEFAEGFYYGLGTTL